MELNELYKIFIAHPLVTTDTRNCPKDSLFFALRGETFNGNEYALKALELGCSYAVIDDANFADANNPKLILVDNVLKTMQDLAHLHRTTLGTKIIQITGTNGKTTTKELVSAVLSQGHRVLFTEGNFNNHIGVPKTLLRLSRYNDIAVVETGANHPGEIAELSKIVDADCGLITNVGVAHLEGFGSFEGVVHTKGELYDYLRSKENSFIFINKDNKHLLSIASGLKMVAYGNSKSEDSEIESIEPIVTGEVIECNPYVKFKWHAGKGTWHEVETQLIGAYNIDNLLAAVTVGLHFGVKADRIDAALKAYLPSNNRSQLKNTGKNHLVIDAYNANPTSMRAALENFLDMKVGSKMLILGEMKELGVGSAEEHQKVVDFLKKNKAKKVWLVGNEFVKLNSGFRCFNNVDEVKAELKANPIKNHYILIKGSNGTKLFQLPELL